MFSVTVKQLLTKMCLLKENGILNLLRSGSADRCGKDVLIKGTLAVGAKGSAYFIDQKQHKVFIFHNSGKFIRSFGNKGEGPGEFKAAWKIFAKGGKIFVPDFGYLSIFNKDGKYEKRETIKELGYFSTSIAFFDSKTIAYLKEGDDGNENIYIYDMNTNRSKRIFSYKAPKRKKIPGVMRSNDNVVGYADKGGILIGKKNKYEIREFDIEGNEKLSFIIKDREKKKITIETKRSEARRRIARGYTVAMGGKVIKPKEKFLIKYMPDRATEFFERIYKDINGFIYVFRSKWENDGEEKKIDIFSPDGKYYYNGELLLPDNLMILNKPVFYNDFLYAFTENEEGERKLMKFKIKLPEF